VDLAFGPPVGQRIQVLSERGEPMYWLRIPVSRHRNKDLFCPMSIPAASGRSTGSFIDVPVPRNSLNTSAIADVTDPSAAAYSEWFAKRYTDMNNNNL